MRILLIHPSVVNDTAQPPLGVAYVASYLDSMGEHDVSLLDFAQLAPERSFAVLKEKIEELNPAIMGVSFLTTQQPTAMKYFGIAKSVRPDTFTVAGGVHTSALPEEVLGSTSVDFAVIGEGELTMKELAEAIANGERAYERIRGLGFKKDSKVIINPPRELIEDLDYLPMPFWKDLSMNDYTDRASRYADSKYAGPRNEVKFFSLLTTRGCSNNCTFCAVNVVHKRRLRFRSPKKVFGEIKWLYNTYGARYFQIVDDTATTKRENMLALCRMLIDSGIGVRWTCKSRVNTVDAEMLEYMKKAGCRLISYGAESGDEEILRKIRKNITLEQIKKAFTMTKDAGISSEAFFMVGNLGETWDSVRHTIDFIRELEADDVSCSITVPFPGTEIYKTAKEKGWLEGVDYAKFNAAFHFVGDAFPIMRTEAMSQRELLKAYYKVNGGIVMKKMKTAYGNQFYLNPTFYNREILFRMRSMGIRRLASVVGNLFVNVDPSGERAS